VTGELPPEKSPVGNAPAQNVEQKILTVMGKEEIIDHKISDVTKEIVVVGDHIKKHGGKRVALYLPNSMEFLTTVFGMLLR
jgi:acyl-CoA synthetase (AMP-forming)/AMP-acid ligase II